MHILLQLGWFGGWVLGIIGFFSARSALSELNRLRAMLSAQAPQTLNAQAPRPRTLAESREIPPVRDVVPTSPIKPLPPTPSRRDFEALITMNWGTWLGSAALLFAGIFLVRYAVEQDLLGPAARCGLAALLGLLLLAAAEFLHRHEGPPVVGRFRIDQAPGGLAAGGTAIVFGAAYGAGPFFGLLSPLVAFTAMAAASLIALAAALRYGPLIAAIGIVAAFATPAMVATQTPSLPGLFGYLFLVSAAALVVVRRTAWTWLCWATTMAGAIWVCLAAIPAAPDRWAAAVFVVAVAVLNLQLLPTAALDHPVGRRLAWVPFATLGAAGLVLAIFAPGTAPRAALLLLSPVAVWKGISEPRLDRLPWIAALFGLLMLLVWGLPAWPSIATDAIQPLITAAALLAAYHAGTGLWQERRGKNPLHWAALVAAVPVLSLAGIYGRITEFETGTAWAATAFALAAALAVTAAASMREHDRQRIGVHAAGVVAALALGCAMALRDYWFTLAIALFLPPLAWVEARADLPALRRVALVVSGLVIVRLVPNWYVLDYAFGTMPTVNGLLAGYAAPAACFALASVLFRQRGDDRLVATLEAGAVTFFVLFVALEIRHWDSGGELEAPVSFAEAAIHLLTIAIQASAYLYLAQRTGRLVLDWAWRILGGLALAYGVGVLAFNPMLTGASAGVLTLFAAYIGPCCLAVLARQRLSDPRLRDALGAYAVAAGFAWITLQIRQSFHPGAMGLHDAPIKAAELWGWSGGWLVYGIGLMVQGIRTRQKLIRLSALGVIALVCVKVFAVDMSGLTGLWRVLSFLGLGLALIGLGAAYRRYVLPTVQTLA